MLVKDRMARAGAAASLLILAVTACGRALEDQPSDGFGGEQAGGKGGSVPSQTSKSGAGGSAHPARGGGDSTSDAGASADGGAPDSESGAGEPGIGGAAGSEFGSGGAGSGAVGGAEAGGAEGGRAGSGGAATGGVAGANSAGGSAEGGGAGSGAGGGSSAGSAGSAQGGGSGSGGAGGVGGGAQLPPLVPWVGVPDWSTFQGNSAHTAFVPVDLDPNQFTKRWELAVDGALSTGSVWGMYLNTITTHGGRFFMASGTTLSARREDDSGLEWQYNFSGLLYPSVNPPAAGGGMVYIAAGQQSSTTLFGFEAASGNVAFRSPMSSQWEHYLAPTIGEQGVYTNAGTYGGLYAFKASGEPRFLAHAAQTDMWTPAVDANAVYVYTGSLAMFDPITGVSLGSIADPTFTNFVYAMNGAPVLGATGSVFAANYVNSHIGGHGNTLLNFDTSSKTIRWQVSGQYPTTPAYAEGVLYVANNGPFRLEARAESDGALLWAWTPPDAAESSFFSEVLLTNNLVFVSTDRATYAIDRQTHHSVWKYPLPSSLALSRSGILYLEGATTLTAVNVK